MILNSGVIETLGGLPANASVCKVDLMPQFLIDCADEDRHFSIEYRNFIHMAYDSLKANGKMDRELEVSFNTSFGPADEDRVDEWEIIAAGRALKNLHTLMVSQ